MKTLCICLLVLAPVVVRAQLPPIRITRFEEPGVLAWTNRLRPAQPVYEVLRADDLAGPWQRVVLVTNQTSLPLTNPVGGPAFYRVAWVGETPSPFSYSFDEGYGLPAVTGSLNVTLLPASLGSWACHETAFVLDGRHPTGTGQLHLGSAWVTPSGEHRLRTYLTGFGIEGSVYLDGVLQRGQAGGDCVYTSFSGTVFEVTFSGTDAIGTFTAERTP